MKKLLLPFSALTILFAACSSDKQPEREMLFLSDSTALQTNIGSDTAAISQAAPEPEAPKVKEYTPAPKRTVIVRQAPIRQAPEIIYEQPPITQAPAPTPAPEPTVSTGTETAGTSDGPGDVPATASKKEGMSKSAKGAIIGGVAGAAAGAVISKKGKGAIIGGVIGAAGGYILGRKQDKKDGRIE